MTPHMVTVEHMYQRIDDARKQERGYWGARWAIWLEKIADGSRDIQYKVYLREIARRIRENDFPSSGDAEVLQPSEEPKQIEPFEFFKIDGLVNKINELVEAVNKLSRNQEDRS